MVIWLIGWLVKVVVAVDDDPWCGVLVVNDRLIVTVVSFGILVLSVLYLILCICSCTGLLIWVKLCGIEMHPSLPLNTDSDGQILKDSKEEIVSSDLLFDRCNRHGR